MNMTKVELLIKHRQAVMELHEAGLIGFHLPIAMMIHDKHESDLRVNAVAPILELSKAFKYSRNNIHVILRKMREEI